jgi:beta-phosphoglucomutase-like phosphatase (HAD superfamily)
VTDGTLVFAPLDLDAVDVLLCDADGNLFGSEEPAFVASTAVTNELLGSYGIPRSFRPDELRRFAMGRNFRSTVQALAADAGLEIDDEVLERWVVTERHAVVEELSRVLQPDPAVRDVLDILRHRVRLAVVTSSARTRLDACLRATGLDGLFPPDVRFSAEDSLPLPTSKPDPAIYRFAGEQLDVAGARGLAVEDAVAGVRSAVAAGFPTVGNLHFVPGAELDERVTALGQAGTAAIVPTWWHLGRLLASGRRRRIVAC